MSSFLRRRAQALIAQAETCFAEAADEDALNLLSRACYLLRGCRPSTSELSALLRRVGDIAASLGDDELSDESYLEARRREAEYDE